jgi:hypothetical protein
LADLAASVGNDVEGMAPECLEVTRRLVDCGFLWPAEWIMNSHHMDYELTIPSST